MENAPLVVVKKNILTPAPAIVSKAKTSEPTLGIKFVTAGVAACIADLVTFPLDTAKVRLQIQGEGSSGSLKQSALSVAKQSAPRYSGLVGTVCTISRQEGPRALYNGLAPGLQRQMCFASIRIGLYDTVKQSYSNLFDNVGMGGGIMVRLLAGSTTGAMAVACAQPTDVVKVRMQAQKAGTKRYSGVIAAYRMIAQQEGMKGLWKGTSPNIARNAVINCCELVTYDMIKEKILAWQLMNDSLPCHFLSATGAGFIATVIGSPVDVVKTRFMNSASGTYSGVFNCAITMFKNEGFAAFYKGFTPSFTRLVSWNIVMFVTYEQLKKAASARHEKKLLPTIEIKTNNQRYM